MPHVKKPILVAKIAINAAIAELQINGIAKIGFNTNGKPKTTGSLIPQIPGTIENLAIALWSSRLENNNIAINNDSVIPPPPTTTKLVQNPLVKIFVATSVSYTHLDVYKRQRYIFSNS